MSELIENQITCPNCGTSFNVESALSHKLEAHIKAEYEKKIALVSNRFKTEQEKLATEKKQFEELKARENELFNERLKKQTEIAKAQLEASVKEQVNEQVKSLEKEIESRRNEVKTLKQNELSILKREAELKERQEMLQLELEKEMLKRQKEIEDKAMLREREKFELEKIHLLKQIEDNRKLAEEMKRKAEQGSMQLQGEVQELAIEEWLREQFPLDSIDEVRKGARGADCLQVVNTRTHQNCGTIYYESKRTKDFQPSWIEKFKEDMRNQNATIGVIVTEAMPKEMTRMGMKEGIWICNYNEFKGLCAVLRESVIQISQAVTTQENKGDKMVMLYDYLISNEFRLQIEAIVEGFTDMQHELDRERRAMEGIWKKREKQIQKVLLNTNHMYHSIKGIAGSAIAALPQLELGYEPEKDE
jgi:hypothetical protein